MYIRKLTKQVICDYGKAEARTEEGWLRGVISDGTFVFRGIRYAQAERFGMPRPATPWKGVKEALVYGFACPEIFTPIPHDQYTVPHYFCVQSEDCQYLNVWTQSLAPDAKKPVMVWLHGGGFFSGSGVEHYAYDGENMSKYGDVVVVTLNHRLNLLGFLDLSAYGAEYARSGNCGMADIVEALRWIRRNIGAFGGDADNVTIFGQSGGAGKVAALMQMPAADGLFHRAVLQSGGMRREPDRTPEKARLLTENVLKRLGVTAQNIGDLGNMYYDELAIAANAAVKDTEAALGERISWGPVADGAYYLGHPFNVGFRPESAAIPLLCGTVLGEFSNNYSSPRGEGSKNSWPLSYTAEMLRDAFGKATDALVSAFCRAYPDKNIADLLFMDGSGRRNCLDFARLHAQFTDAGTYNYMFALEFPFNGGTLPWHNAEIPYVFRNADYLEPSFIPGVTEGLQDMLCAAWCNFAERGDPNGGAAPAWPRFSPTEEKTMIFDRQVRVGTAYDAELLDRLPPTASRVADLMGKKK